MGVREIHKASYIPICGGNCLIPLPCLLRKEAWGMHIALISEKQLFAEVIIELLLAHPEFETRLIVRSEVDTFLANANPEVMIIDENLDEEGIEAVLIACRKLDNVRVIFLNPGRNGVVVLDSQQLMIGKVDDLFELIKEKSAPENANTENESFPENASVAHARSAMCGFIAHLLNHRPDRDLVKNLRGADTFVLSSSEAGIAISVLEGVREMTDFIEETTGWPEGEVEHALAVDWTRLFRGVGPGYGPPPPYEGVYRGGDGVGVEIVQDINRNYLEYGLGINPEHPNRPDYLGLEMDFLGHLSEREAEAWALGKEKEAEKFNVKYVNFMIDHLYQWVDHFCDQAIQEARTAFYRGFVKILSAVVAETGETGI